MTMGRDIAAAGASTSISRSKIRRELHPHASISVWGMVECGSGNASCGTEIALNPDLRRSPVDFNVKLASGQGALTKQNIASRVRLLTCSLVALPDGQPPYFPAGGG